MPKYRDPKQVVSSYFSHLGTLESNSAALYDTIVKKVKIPTVQGLLQKIASDGQRHSSLLRDLSEKLMIPSVKSIINETEFGDAFKIIYVVHQDVENRETLGAVDLLAISAKLAILEKLIAEKYIITQSRITKALTRIVSELQNASLDSFKSFFDRIAYDEAEHQKLLASIEGLIGASEHMTMAEIKTEVQQLPLELPHEAHLLEGHIKKEQD